MDVCERPDGGHGHLLQRPRARRHRDGRGLLRRRCSRASALCLRAQHGRVGANGHRDRVGLHARDGRRLHQRQAGGIYREARRAVAARGRRNHPLGDGRWRSAADGASPAARIPRARGAQPARRGSLPLLYTLYPARARPRDCGPTRGRTFSIRTWRRSHTCRATGYSSLGRGGRAAEFVASWRRGAQGHRAPEYREVASWDELMRQVRRGSVPRTAAPDFPKCPRCPWRSNYPIS